MNAITCRRASERMLRPYFGAVRCHRAGRQSVQNTSLYSVIEVQ
ncbi:hypothetical protein O6R05_01600 [Peptoniphilus equinus]|uniref:Uncharacterized protein n=1 Tax=Peptoniphilus equinus TaxID=3016343 RepID=A0ABY7QVI9_9FIRM|nr:hypothetical protein [Peptoniphilus equinus]WBW50265.1 hypothetical protein O6R05_01600 [Peptoniphilus equinus]